MANPLCRAAINRRVTGSPHVWPLDWFAREFSSGGFRRGLSLGCGMGSLERSARKIGLCESILGLDFSPASLGAARERARAEGVRGVTYAAANLNEADFGTEAFDVVFIHQSLHHVVEVENLLDAAARALAPEGVVYLDEWTGPSQDEWTPSKLSRAAALFSAAPRAWRNHRSLKPPISMDDPSEAIRSSAILPAARARFTAVVERPYGGQLVAILLSQMNATAAADPAFPRALAHWLDLEDDEIRRDPSASYHTVAVLQPK
ncbi:MAG: class I SAM-dependent methyltransferase [Acidobacteriota bacterium]|nr:class I SAM-dependent methyltransferase [Acidobacteriota bacterium]